jgi:branched-chain amino acid transport system substrate-binding protein
MRKRKLFLSFVLSLCLAVPAGAAFAEEGVTDTEVRVGVVSDLTGPTAIGGVGMADAIVSYFKQVNEAGGIHGRKVKVIVEDCAYSPARAVAAAKKLMAKDGVFAFVSPWGTAPTSAMIPLAQKEKIPIAPACSLATSIYDPLKKYVFAAGTNYVDQSLFIVEYVLNTLKIKNPKIGIFCQDDDWGKDHIKGLEIAKKKYNLPDFTVQTYKYNAVEFKSQVINMMKAKPDVVIVASAIKSGAVFLQTAAKLKFKSTFIASNTLGFVPILKLSGPLGANMLVVNIFAMPGEDVPGMKKLIAASKKYFGDKWMPADQKIHPYYVYGWINAMIFAEGLKKAGKNLTRDGLVKAMESIKDFDPEGLMGPVSYSAESHDTPGYARMTQGDAKNMRFKVLTDWTYIKE